MFELKKISEFYYDVPEIIERLMKGEEYSIKEFKRIKEFKLKYPELLEQIKFIKNRKGDQL